MPTFQLADLDAPATSPFRRASPVPRAGRDPLLEAIASNVEAGERLSIGDGETLYATRDLWTVCELADLVRRRLHGDVAYYNVNRHLNYSNVCALSCKFCEFYRKEGDEGAYTRDMAYVREETRKAVESGATEMHVVGGLNPSVPFDYYVELVGVIRQESERAAGGGIEAGGGESDGATERRSDEEEEGRGRREGGRLHIKAFTAVEIVHLAKIAKVYKQNDRKAGIRWVLERLKEAGLGSLPGGGAEVFDDRVHDEAYKGKIRSDVWLDVHRVAHELGLNTNATILYGHIEDRRERLVHMDMLRRAQDEALARIGYEPGRASQRDGEIARQGGGEESSKLKAQSSNAGEEIGAVPLTRPGLALPMPGGAAAHACGSRPVSLSRCLADSLPTPGGYFQTIIPLPFVPDGSDLEHLPGPSGLENLRTLAIARLMLDNFPHVKAFWIMQTLPMAELMLRSGADDVDGTVVWYDITKVGGASTHQEVNVGTLKKTVRAAGFVPVERDTLYRRVGREGGRWWVEG